MSIDLGDGPRLTTSDLIDLERDAGQQFGPFHRQWLLERAPDKVRRHLELARQGRGIYGMPTQGFTAPNQGPGSVSTAIFGARNSASTELNMLQDASTGASAATAQAVINQYQAIPANDAYAGKIYEVKMGGVYGNTSTPTMIFTPRWGSSTTPATNITFGASPTWTSITGTTGLAYYIQFTVVIRTAGPGATIGTAIGTGFAALSIPVTSSQLAAVQTMGATAATIDTTGQGTAGCGITINLTWSANSASNTSTCHWHVLSSLN